MALDLSKMTARTGTTMPKAARGRTATPIPDNFLSAVKETYTLPEGQGGMMRVPNGDLNDDGKDSNVTTVVGTLRRAATALGYGLSVKVMERGEKNTDVLFRAKDKSERVRAPKPDNIFVIDTDEGAVDVSDNEDNPDARLATVGEARALGYDWTESDGWFYPAEDGSEG